MANYPIQFPYGSVYFRKSNPPKRDWERDYKRASEDGINIFRHWFIWGSIEVAPGVYDWEDYDRQLELAGKYGIKTIIGEISTSVPEWAVSRYPELLPKDMKRDTVYPEMGVSCATGGFHTGFCLDKPAVREMVAEFLHNLAGRYKNYDALLGYDVANENYLHKDICYCEETVQRFRSWLIRKYRNINSLNQAWLKFSYTDFSEVMPPYKLGFFEESADWLSFRRDQLQENIRWKIATIKEADSKHLITAHGMAATFASYSENCCNDWESAKNVEVYGVTWVQCRKGNEPWKQFSSMELTRSAADGKTFWHTEAQGGPLWLQPQLYGREREDGRIVREGDVRIWNLISMACGARGIIYTRHRPLLEGPLFGGFAPYDMDGSRTERSQMASILAKWSNDSKQKELLEAKPTKGDIGILFIPECETASFLLSHYGNDHIYAPMMWGAYRGFFDNNIQADYVHIENIASEKVIYLPYPVAMTKKHADDLKAWVSNGGTLICEACPAYFGDGLHAGEVQPNYGLEEMFGVRQNNAEFMPDIMEDMTFNMLGETVYGGGYLQTYDLTSAKVAAMSKDNIIAAENRYGEGKTLIIGTNISYGYYQHSEHSDGRIFMKLLEEFAGLRQKVKVSDRNIIARIHNNKDKKYLWVLNPTAVERSVIIACQALGGYGNIYWQGGNIYHNAPGSLHMTVESMNAIIVEIIEGGY